MRLILVAASWLCAATISLTDFSVARDVVGATQVGATMTPEIDSVRYRNLTGVDTLISGKLSTAGNERQAAWPMILPMSEGNFKLSYIWFNEPSGMFGNYLFEKNIELKSDINSIVVTTPLDPLQAHRDSMGLLLTKRLSQVPGQKVAGMNAKGFNLSNGRNVRVMQAWGGAKDSIYIVDTTDNLNQIAAMSLMDSALTLQSYPDYCINVTYDTLFTVFSPNNSRIMISPYKLGHPNTAQKGITRTIVDDGVFRRDYGIARDPVSGNFLVTAFKTTGTAVEAFRVTSAFAMTHSLTLQSGLPAHNTNARIISVVSIGSNRFAVTYFMPATGGTFMSIVDISTNVTVVSTITIDAGRSLIPNVYFNAGRLAVVWFKDLAATANNCRVYGKIFSVENGAIADTLFSGAISASGSISESYFNSPANYRLGVALDSYGNLATSFMHQNDCRMYFVAHVPTFFFGDTGLFTLRDSLSAGSYGSFASDSIKYSGFSALNSGRGSVELLFKTSADGAFSSPFVPVTNLSTVSTLAGSRFDLRFRMISGVVKSDGPRVASASLDANIKPKSAKIDSLSIGMNSRRTVNSGDTILVKRGLDSLRLYFSAVDYEDASYLQYYLSGYRSTSATIQKSSTQIYAGTASIAATNFNDTVIKLSFSVVDTNGWGSDSFKIYVRSYNPAPIDSVRARVYTVSNAFSLDSLVGEGDTIFAIDSGYNVIVTSGRDSNSATLKKKFYYNGVLLSTDSGSLSYLDTVYADSIHGVDTVTAVIEDLYGLKDSTRFFLRVSHLPSLDSVYYKSKSRQIEIPLDSISFKISTNEPDTIFIKARDPDVIIDDRLTFRLMADGVLDTSCTIADSSVIFYRAPSNTTRRLAIIVSDQSGVMDSTVIHLLFPRAEMSSFSSDSIYLQDSLVVYTERRTQTREGTNASSYRIPLRSAGSDSLYVNSIRLKRKGRSGAFSIGTSVTRTSAVLFDTSVTLRKVAPNDSIFIALRDSAAIPFSDSASIPLSQYYNDTTLHDTIIVTTNDPEYDTLLFPLRLLIKEPPFVVTDSIRFRGNGNPFAIVFSEPLQRSDTSIAPMILYSHLDSLKTATILGRDTTPVMPVQLSFVKGSTSRFDTLFFTPRCSSGAYVSSHFNLTPRNGFFISTDRVRVKLSANIRDGSGNRIDLNGDKKPDSLNAFKRFTKVIDSSSLTIAALFPDSSAISISPVPTISVTFTSPLNAAYIDTAKVSNRSVRIRSSSFPDRDMPLASSPSVNGNVLSFRAAGGFPGNDTVTVTISASIRDSFGGTLDGNRNGLGSFFYLYGNSSYSIADTFITSSTLTGGDNYSWIFYTAPQDFYVFPVPFEPSRNSRHNTQGGIVFKNIQTLLRGQSGINAVDVAIFTPDGVPVYSTARKGETISVGPGSQPTWMWTGKNHGGKPVASGLYIYCVVSGDGKKVLKKGKLVIVR
ncbi:MAG: Ig-like domain-containing protein [Fibrobacteres bacterium]|nr:Ig-like domain-containing protein [Fibrobacterota bacterium]